MRERPILFSAPMVRAILSGTKTVTRRLVKLPKRVLWEIERGGTVPEQILLTGDGLGWVGWWSIGDQVGPVTQERCSQLYPTAKKANKLPCAVGDRLWVREAWAQTDGRYERFPLAYRATDDGQGFALLDGVWRPSIHMPRWASRLDLEVVSVRAERLQEITEEDVYAEGVGHGRVSPLLEFEELWDAINGNRATFASNPWVWRIEFSQVTP